MKTSVFAFIALCFTLCAPFTSGATNYNDNGSSSIYTLFSGDTLKLLSGSFGGGIVSLNNGAVVVISPSATFKPNYIYTLKGKIINYGNIKFTYALGSAEGFDLENYGTAIFQQDLSLYDGTLPQTINNYVGATLSIKGNFSMGANTALNNNGIMSVDRDFNLYKSTSVVNNNRTIDIAGNINMSAGNLTNDYIMNANQFNFWGGQLKNEGELNSAGDFTVSAGQTYENKCRLVTPGAIRNYGTLKNSGVIWVGNNAPSDEFYNSGTYITSGTAKLRAVKLTNYGTMSGAGYLYFTGSTYSSGQVGVSGYTTDSIRIYDATRSNSSQIFDTQYGTVQPNTVFKQFAEPDTTEMYAGCSAAYRSASAALPVSWSYFYARLTNDKPMLFWSAAYEENMQFEIERSYDNASFTRIATVTSNKTAVYNFTDEGADMNQQSIGYRIKATSRVDGAVKYSTIQIVHPGKKQIATVSVYPNPTADNAAVLYTASSNEQVTVRIMSAGAQQLLLKNFTATAGANRFELTEVKNLKPGAYVLDVISGNAIVATQKLVKK